jgi:hypothetical protein
VESVHLQIPADLLARVDEAAGDVPRNRWIRRAIEGALSAPGDSIATTVTGHWCSQCGTHDHWGTGWLNGATFFTRAQAEDFAARRVSEISPARSTAQVKRDVQPRTEGLRKK